MTPQPRDFTKEFKDNILALGMPDELFAGSPLTLEMLCTEMEKHLQHISITNEVFTLDTFKSILGKDLNLEEVSKVLNFLVVQNATVLQLTLPAFVQFQTDIRAVIKNYNGIIAPIKEAVEKEAKKYQVQQNPPGTMKVAKG